MQRYIVTRLWIKYKGKIYQKGELLPEGFTHHDKYRHIHSSRIGFAPAVPVETVAIPVTADVALSGNTPVTPIPVTPILDAPVTVIIDESVKPEEVVELKKAVSTVPIARPIKPATSAVKKTTTQPTKKGISG